MRRLRWVWLLALAAAAIAVWVRYRERVVGTHDVRMVYAFEPADVATPAAAESVKSRAHARLTAAKITADVDLDLAGHTLTLTVDQAATRSVDTLLRWRGGVAIHRLDPAYVLDPPDTSGLVASTEVASPPPAATVWSGPHADVARAARAMKPDAEHAIMEQRLDHLRSCLRVVKKVPAGDLAGLVRRVEPAEGGRALAFRLEPKGVEIVGKLPAGERFVIAWAHSVLAVQALPAAPSDPIVVSFGADIYAYDVAYRLRKILGTLPLPALRQASVTPLAVDYRLAAAAISVPVLLSFGWLFFVRRFDRAAPEPLWLVLATFALGGAVAPLSGVLKGWVYQLSPYLDPHLQTLGGQMMGFPLTLVTSALIIGGGEEGVKFLATWTLARQRREFDEPVDGIVYSAAASLGFAAAENLQYFDKGRLGSQLITVRALFSAPAHLFFGAIWGYALGQTLVRKKFRVWPFFLLAALAHGAFDTFCFIDRLGFLTSAENALLAGVFVILLRRALRHGRVTPEAAAAAAEGRLLFRSGRHQVFLALTLALHLVAWLLVALGRRFEAEHHRVSYEFLAVAGALLLVLGAIASALARNLPLDVVVDAWGVTFAGAARPWASIMGVRREKRQLRLASSEGDLLLGPTDPATTEALLAAIRERSGLAG